MASNTEGHLKLCALAVAVLGSTMAGMDSMNVSPANAQTLRAIADTLRVIAGDIDEIAATLIVEEVPHG